jgi:hypothetical protein
MSPSRLFVAVLLGTVLGACSDPANTQYVPIGTRCSASSVCGTPPYGCALGEPNGYCQKDCNTDGDCPKDSVCVARECKRSCVDSTQCRGPEGYACLAVVGATVNVCVPNGVTPAVDAGTD